ncbi:MAG: hypothetical protein V2A61_01970, partial [Calditrichota bacterium]
MVWTSPRQVAAMGTDFKYLILDHGDEVKKNRYEYIEPFIARVETQSDSVPPDVVWNLPLQANEYPYYNIISDDHLTYMPGSGQIKDWKFRKYTPVFDMEDRHYDRRYICYPGLGMGVADEGLHSLDIIIPGPAGNDVKAIAFKDGGFIWTGGESDIRDGGISLFDRETGRWQRFDAELTQGLESHRIRDILTYNDRIYFASAAGLTILQPDAERWKTLDRFNGLTGPGLRVLAAVSGQLFMGGDQGVNIMTLPQGLIYSSGDEIVDEMACADITAEGDTVWIAGMAGVYRWDPLNEWQRIGAEEPIVGDEAARCIDVHHNRLWIGGRRGLREFNRRTGTWRGWPAGTYLRGSAAVSLESNDSLLWVGTTRGLFVLNYRKGSWLSYEGEIGLPQTAIQTLALEADSLWLGTSQGLTRFIWNRPERDVF